MTPALAHGSLLPCATTLALTPPFPARGWETRWNWSAVPQMSPPPPSIVHVPLTSTWSPDGVAPPTSAQLQLPGQRTGGGGAVVATLTVSNVAVVVEAVLCDVAAMPASTSPPMPSTWHDPWTYRHETPSAD